MEAHLMSIDTVKERIEELEKANERLDDLFEEATDGDEAMRINFQFANNLREIHRLRGLLHEGEDS